MSFEDENVSTRSFVGFTFSYNHCIPKRMVPGIGNQKLGKWILALDLPLTAEWSLATASERW